MCVPPPSTPHPTPLSASGAEPLCSRRAKLALYPSRPPLPPPPQTQLLGPPRVWLKNANVPGLNMSRSLGDLTGKIAGVISTPHASVEPLGAGDHALILASDGLWDVVPNEEVTAVGLSSADCWEAAARLARLTRARWLVRTGGADDTTVVVVRLLAEG